jgi:hypothetical protein
LLDSIELVAYGNDRPSELPAVAWIAVASREETPRTAVTGRASSQSRMRLT